VALPTRILEPAFAIYYDPVVSATAAASVQVVNIPILTMLAAEFTAALRYTLQPLFTGLRLPRIACQISFSVTDLAFYVSGGINLGCIVRVTCRRR
jgi:hypothetical protein